jgi:GNAT superfamily N-acetyltransferase
MTVPETPIARLVGRKAIAAALPQLEAIMLGASGRTLEPGPERDAFQERWLWRYLQGGSDVALVAWAGPGLVAGYLVGALENPALQERFHDLPYFRDDFSGLCESFPAHLHINLSPAFRSQGIGARLIIAFADHARHARAPGMHVVTGRGMRNVGFYERCGFTERGSATWNGQEIVFLGRNLGPPA